MNAYEYLNALRKALDVLPDDERANAIRYYEEYFLDAGPENEQTVIAELGTPEQVAQNILNEYTEIARTAPRQQTDGPQQAEQAETPPRGFQKDSSFVPPRQSPLLTFLAICGAVFFGLLVGLPLFGTAAALIFSAAATVFFLLLAAVIAVAALVIVLPASLLLAGFLLCVCSLFIWTTPASAILTLGAGLCLLALGGMLTIGCIRLCAVAFRPVMNAFGWCIELCGKCVRWCCDVVRRFLDRLKGF